MTLFAELMSFRADLPDGDDLCFSSWPGPFETANDEPAFGDFLEAIPSYSSSHPTTSTRQMAPSGSFSSDAAEPPLQKGRSLSSELGEPDPKKLTAAERKLQSNRKAQKKFRARQKERSHDAEMRLLETSAKLQEMQMKQKELEARNLLLEKVARLSKQSVTRNPNPKEPRDVPWEGDSTWQLQPTNNAESQGNTLTLTIWDDQEQTFTIEQASQMPLPDFGKIWQEYVRKLGACLVDGASDSASEQSMHRWAAEATSLMVCIALRNPWAIKAFNAAVDSGTAAEEGVEGSSSVQQAHSEELLTVLQYTEEQVLDLMHLRRLFYGKIGQLCRERKSLLKQMSNEQDVGAGLGLDDVSVRLSEVSELAEQLQANGADEYRTYMQFTSAFLRGAHTSRQLAATIVHTHPWVPCKHLLLEELASQRGQPPDSQLLNAPESDGLEYSVQWQEVVAYLQRINPGNLHQHVPLRQQQLPGHNIDDLALAQEVLEALL